MRPRDNASVLSSKRVVNHMSRVLGGVVAAVCLLTATGSALLQTPADLTLVSSTDRQPLTVVQSGEDQQEMARLGDLVRIFDLDVQDESRPNTITVTHADRVMILTAGQPVVSVAGRLVSLRTSAPRRDGDDWLVPLEFLSRALGRLLEETIVLRPGLSTGPHRRRTSPPDQRSIPCARLGGAAGCRDPARDAVYPDTGA